MNLIILKSILDTLGNVEVHGKEHMVRLVACMNALEQLIQEASRPDQPEEAPEPECQAEPSENE